MHRKDAAYHDEAIIELEMPVLGRFFLLSELDELFFDLGRSCF